VLLVQYLYSHHDPNSPILLTQTLYWGRPGQLKLTVPSVIFMLHYFEVDCENETFESFR